jgi:hypothetical protein
MKATEIAENMTLSACDLRLIDDAGLDLRTYHYGTARTFQLGDSYIDIRNEPDGGASWETCWRDPSRGTSVVARSGCAGWEDVEQRITKTVSNWVHLSVMKALGQY